MVDLVYGTLLIGAEGTDSCGKSGSRETPQERSDEEAPDRPRKASAWSGNQQTPFISQTKKDRAVFARFFCLMGKI
ncbi:hypothetical protein ACF5W4_00435 [Bacillota bacterium Lsc_1132]